MPPNEDYRDALAGGLPSQEGCPSPQHWAFLASFRLGIRRGWWPLTPALRAIGFASSGCAAAILFGRNGESPAQSHPARARIKFGSGSLGDVRYAADILAGVAGGCGAFAAFSLRAESPALLRKGRRMPWVGNWISPATFCRLGRWVREIRPTRAGWAIAY